MPWSLCRKRRSGHECTGGRRELGGRGVTRNKKTDPLSSRRYPTSPPCPRARAAAGAGPSLPSPCLLTWPSLAWGWTELPGHTRERRDCRSCHPLPRHKPASFTKLWYFLPGTHTRLVPLDVCPDCRQLSLWDPAGMTARAGSLPLVPSHQINLVQQYKQNTHASSGSHI